jgi:dGTPase
VLNGLCTGGFRHYEQSLRVVDVLESTRRGQGLNLTEEVRDGILNHSLGKRILQGNGDRVALTVEGDLVAVCDAIAYINHDVDDAIRAEVITLADLPQDAVKVLGATSSERIDRMVVGIIESSSDGAIRMQEDVREATVAIRTYLYREVYPHPRINLEIEKAKKIVRELFEYFLHHPDETGPPADPDDTPERRTADMIAGMTDQYALALYTRLFFPQEWPL